MTMKKWSQTETKSEALDIAKGLYESRVFVQRPPSLAQKGAYHIPGQRHSTRPFSAVAKVSTERTSNLPLVPPRKPKPQVPWRPASSFASISYRPAPLCNVTLKDQKQTVESTNMVPEVYKDRLLPKGLSNIQNWLTAEMNEDWPAAYRPENSFVFLPTLECRTESLPLAPPVQSPDEPLVYIPEREPQIYRPPRPKSKKVIEICRRPRPKSKKFVEFEFKEEIKTTRTRPPARTRSRTSESDSLSLLSSRSSQMKFYNKDGDLLQDTYQGKRTEEIIRQEIEDLENLLRGIGNPRSSSLVVRYQYDITHLRDLANTTLRECHFLPEEEPVTQPSSLQNDLLQEEKDDFITSVMKQRDACIEELFEIEKRIMGKKEIKEDYVLC